MTDNTMTGAERLAQVLEALKLWPGRGDRVAAALDGCVLLTAEEMEVVPCPYCQQTGPSHLGTCQLSMMNKGPGAVYTVYAVRSALLTPEQP